MPQSQRAAKLRRREEERLRQVKALRPPRALPPPPPTVIYADSPSRVQPLPMSVGTNLDLPPQPVDVTTSRRSVQPMSMPVRQDLIPGRGMGNFISEAVGPDIEQEIDRTSTSQAPVNMGRFIMDSRPKDKPLIERVLRNLPVTQMATRPRSSMPFSMSDGQLAAKHKQTNAVLQSQAITPRGSIDTMRPMPTPVDQRISPSPSMPLVSSGGVDPRLTEADQLTQQAAPPPPIQGAGRQMMRGALEGIASLGHPQGFSGYRNDQLDRERQRQQDLLERAKQLRGESVQQQELQQRNRQIGLQEQGLETDRQTLGLTQRNIESQIADREREKFGYGANVGTFSERTGAVKTPPTDLTQTAPRGQQYRDAVTNGRTIRKYFDPANPSVVTYQEDIGPAQLPSVPGAFQFMVNPQGVVTAKGNTETGDITPVENAEGARRNAMPGSVLTEQRNANVSLSRMTDLGTRFKEDFVGPAAGRYLAVKSQLPESMASLPEGYTDFMPLQTEVKNDFIKFMTGAQMSESEARRLSAQVPLGTDRADVWQSKYNNMMKRVRVVKSLLDRQLSAEGLTADDIERMVVEQEAAARNANLGGGGATAQSATPAAPAGGARRGRYNPATGQVEY